MVIREPADPPPADPPRADPPLQVRRATGDDAEAVARVHVETWQGAYAGVVPAEFLAEFDWRQHVSSTRRWLEEPRPWVATTASATTAGARPTTTAATLVATRGEVLGFSTFGPARDDDLKSHSCGEIYAIYVHPDAWSSGLGSALLVASLQALSTYDVVVLWVLEANLRARRFYERHGFRADGASKTISIGGADLPEVRYATTLSGVADGPLGDNYGARTT